MVSCLELTYISWNLRIFVEMGFFFRFSILAIFLNSNFGKLLGVGLYFCRSAS